MKEVKRGDLEEVWLLFLQMVTAQLDMAIVSLYCCNSQATLQPDATTPPICTEQRNTRSCLIWLPVLATATLAWVPGMASQTTTEYVKPAGNCSVNFFLILCYMYVYCVCEEKKCSEVCCND